MVGCNDAISVDGIATELGVDGAVVSKISDGEIDDNVIDEDRGEVLIRGFSRTMDNKEDDISKRNNGPMMKPLASRLWKILNHSMIQVLNCVFLLPTKQ